MYPATPSRILLIDDHRLFVDGLKSLLNSQPGYTVCGEVYKPDDVLTAIQRTQPHLLLLDVNLHGTNGIDLGHRILASYPTLRILILTMYEQPKLAEEARRAGLHGYLLKDATIDQLLGAIQTVLAGRTHFALNSAQPTDDAFGDNFAQKLNLTFREVEIIRLIREGLNSSQIAGQIHISQETVKTHRKNIHFKLGISKVADLIQFANQHDL